MRQCPFCRLGADTLVVFYLFGEIKRGLVRHVAFQHIQDEPFLNGLAHFVLVESYRQIVFGGRPRWIGGTSEEHQRGMLGCAGESKVADVVRTGSRLLKLLQQFFDGQRSHLAVAAHGQRRLELCRRGAGLGVVRLVDDDREILPLEGLIGHDSFHRIREGLDGHDDNGRFRHQGIGQLLTLRLRRFLAINGSNDAKLMVDLFDRILKLTVQYVAVSYDDDAAEDRIAVVTAQLHEIMSCPGNRTGLA